MTVFAPDRLTGTLRPPPDKSISHRAAILAAMSGGESSVTGYLDAADTRSTLDAVRGLGAEVTAVEAGRDRLSVTIRGVGLRGAAPAVVDVGNAGTLLRILPGWLAGQPSGHWTLDGDESIRRRPVDRIVAPLVAMGGRARCREERFPPLVVEGTELRGGVHRLPMASAQVKSCLLLAGLLAAGETAVIEPAPSRDHTERMLDARGVPVSVHDERTLPGMGGPPSRRIAVGPATEVAAVDAAVPGDFSSAAFFIVGTLLAAESEVAIEAVGLNPTRIGLLGILGRMEASFEVTDEHRAGGEVSGSLVARHSELAGVRVRPEEVPSVIDELPLVALAGCFAEGETRVSGAEELRHKESDRIAAVVDGLGGLGADIDATEDGFVVRGTGGLRGGILDARGDHRMAMLGAIAGLASREGVEVRGMEAAAVSYPGFERDLAALT
jgi:3-phosphoshikimate 1-carboxyvinyltransferase